jgi:GTP-binding protein
MPVPKVVIVGRPNVGKSSLLNWLARKRISVVEPTAGVTRDRVTYLMHVDDRYFELVDTGGIGVVDSDDLSDDIQRQIDTGIDEATLILFVVDVSTGRVPLDLDVAGRLRKIDKPVLLVVNKCDSPKHEQEISDFYGLADAPLVCTSVLGERNREKLLNAILRLLPPVEDLELAEGEKEAADPELKLAIVGRRNVGKSTFITALAQTERMIVSEIAGTTRDSVDVRFELDGKSFVAIDTPGVRKKKSLANDIEFYGLTRALRSIRRADIILMFFDASETISMVDKQLVGEISEQHKPCIFVVNKWDLGQEAGMTTEKWSTYLVESLGSMKHVPVAFITAKEEVNVKKLINLAQTIAKQAQIRVPTAKLNSVLRAAIDRNHPPMHGSRHAKIYFATQIDVAPPTIVIKCNDPRLIDKGWQRYLLGALHDALPFPEVPIKVYYRSRARAEDDEPADNLDEHHETETPEIVLTGDEPLDVDLPAEGA